MTLKSRALAREAKIRLGVLQGIVRNHKEATSVTPGLQDDNNPVVAADRFVTEMPRSEIRAGMARGQNAASAPTLGIVTGPISRASQDDTSHS